VVALDEELDELAEAPLLEELLDEDADDVEVVDFDEESDVLALAPSEDELLERESVR
jgi:anti-sigma-K factor RskA